jgi:hypothetical protein
MIRRRPTNPRTADKMMIRFLWLFELFPESGKLEDDIDVEGRMELEIEVLPAYPSVTALVGVEEVDIVDACDGSEEFELEYGTI